MTHSARFVSVTSGPGPRAGVLSLTHGDVLTPTFMPVGTRGSVKGLDSADLAEVGAQMILANTYHLMLRPGAKTVSDLGGLHGFMGWEGPILTDSGGYQIFSLGPRISEEEAVFRSTYDGSTVRLSPEEAVRVQQLLGADVAMVLDVCVGLPASRETVLQSMELTHRWAERSLSAHTRSDQALFGIVQGGVDPELREQSARYLAGLGFAGYGIGGLSVGETPEDRELALAHSVPYLPEDRVRYVMGLGDPEGVLAAVSRGVDLFDCVWPTRLARHGRILTRSGDYNLRRREHHDDDGPLDSECQCPVCLSLSRAYLRHLLSTNELAVFRFLSIHNLAYMMGLLGRSRRAIVEGTFDRFRSEELERRGSGAERRG